MLEVVQAFPDQQTIAVGRHPAGAGEMTVVDMASALGLSLRIETEKNGDGLAPIGVFLGRIETEMGASLGERHRLLGRRGDEREGHRGLFQTYECSSWPASCGP